MAGSSARWRREIRFPAEPSSRKLRKRLPSYTNPCVPPDVSGTVTWVAADGEYTILDPIVTLELPDGSKKDLTLCQKWPIRIPRPDQAALSRFRSSGDRTENPGHHVPIAKGGTACRSRRFRNRKDHDPASDRQMVRCGYHYLYWLRRARQ